MDENTHPLLTKRMGGAIAVLGAGLSIGLTLMSFSPFVVRALGMVVAVAGALGATSIYFDDFKMLRLRLAHRGLPDKPLQAEQWIVLLAITATVLIPAYVWAWQSWPAMPSHRHLTTKQEALMRPILETAATQNSVIQINSIPNCEECEDYGVELRKFFGSLQGWAVNGGVLIFPFDPQLRDGIHLTVDADHQELARRLTEAFDTAHIAITQAAPQKLNAGLHVVILVGKQSL